MKPTYKRLIPAASRTSGDTVFGNPQPDTTSNNLLPKPLASSPALLRPEASIESALSLETLVADFVTALAERFPTRIRRRPKALKRRVLSLVALYLPPHRRRAGRRPQSNITKAVKLYQEQLRQMEAGIRKAVNWLTIARQCVPHYAEIRSNYRRMAITDRLRNAVYSRLKRDGLNRGRRRRV